ncbi:hypothetical protein N1Z88_000763 [Citrobacter amalonaticus]|nr:hypothetical protein [Citrobacter amalonaticus]
MSLKKLVVTEVDKYGFIYSTPVMANVDAGFITISGNRVTVEEVNLPTHKFEARFEKK